MSNWTIGYEDAWYQPPDEPDDVEEYEIPGHLIQAARDWLSVGMDWSAREVEAMHPEQVFEAILECFDSFEDWERINCRSRRIGRAA